ncbi:endonuclease domain-containing protein [Streptomyces sp. NPDC055092]
MQCIYQGCGRSQYSNGLCPGHNTQRKRGKELSPLKSYNRWIGKKKECPGCGELKEREDYSVDKSRAAGVTQYCKECQRWRAIAWTYQLTREQWEGIFQAQGSCCAICKATEPESSLGFVTDHDHSCCPGKKSCGDCIRGIVCHRDNMLADKSEAPEFVAYREAYAAREIPLRDSVT